MNTDKFIVFLLLGLVVVLIVFSYVPFNKDIEDLKENTKEKINNSIFPDNQEQTLDVNKNQDSNLLDDNSFLDTNVIKDKYKETKEKITNTFSKNIPMQVLFCPEDNCLEEILRLINSSKKSIDCAVYDISLSSVTSALKNKADSGVKVRFVSDYGRSKAKLSELGILKNSNVSVITNSDESSYMHNKFCVFDNKIVLVGSMNFTLNGNYKNNNNVLVLDDKELAKVYTKKIDLFFEGDFSKKIKTPPEIKSYGNLENYFCPEDDCLYNLLRVLEDVNSSLECMFFSFTLNDFFENIKDKEISQRYILEKTGVTQYSQYQSLLDYNIPVILDKNPNNMHNKFCIIDEKYIFTGSMNISKNGTKNNHETFLIVYDDDITKKYLDYFNGYWELWGN